MIDIWISTVDTAGLTLMPYPYAFLYDSDTVLKLHISGFPKNLAQYAVLAKLLDLVHNNFSQTLILNLLVLTVPRQGLTP